MHFLWPFVLLTWLTLCQAMEQSETSPPTEIVIRLRRGSSVDDLRNLIIRHPGFELSREFTINGREYKCLEYKGTIDQREAMAFENEDIVEFVEIQYHFKGNRFSTDPELADLWNLNDQIECPQNILSAWNQGYDGRGIIVGIVDELVQTNHTDLIGRVDIENSFDYVANRKEHFPTAEGHGTASAGNVAAIRGNNFCTVGVAYKSIVYAIGLRPDTVQLTDMRVGQSLSHEVKKVDIYSNSWGFNSATSYIPLFNMTREAIQEGITEGREGKGAIYVFAVGNFGPTANTNSIEFLTSIYTIAITSVREEGTVDYGQIGSSILAASYGGTAGKQVVSLELNDGCGLAYGTSTAAPISAGIIALALEANPTLTWRDVQHIIVRTSKRCNFTDNYPPFYQWRTNRAGFSYHPKLGFGVMDALRMVKCARKWKNVSKQYNFTTPLSVINTNATDGLLGEAYIFVQGADNPVDRLEHVIATIKFSITERRGSVEFNLTSPHNTLSPLMTDRPADMRNGTVMWGYMSVHFWGERPEGWWKLNYRSTYKPAVLFMDSWSLTIHGTKGCNQNSKYKKAFRKTRKLKRRW